MSLTAGIGLGPQEAEDEVVSAINTTPLVDVMLVLLIIFLITIPVVIQSTPVDLPKETNQPTQTKPENINIVVTKDGDVFWNNELVDNKKLLARLKEIAVKQPQPEVHVRGDKNARYEFVGRVVFACQRAGIIKIGFITEPPVRGAGAAG
jgi:biopolymer transport protein ExbD